MLIINGRIVTMEKENRILDDGGLLVRDGKIAEIGTTAGLRTRFPDEKIIDAKGQLVMPANICAHTHFYGAYARGMGIPGPAPADFPQILHKLWWGLDKALTLDDVYYSAMVCLLDAVRHGTTTLIDHHASPNAIDGSLDEIARAVLASGVRASLCYEVTDRDGEDRAQAGIRENIRFIRRISQSPEIEPFLSAMFGLHASLTLSEQTLAACRAAAPEGTGFHIHVAEHPVDEYDSLEKCGQRVIDRLDRHGILGPQSVVAHAVHVDAREIEILARTGTWVTHQPRSNMNNAVGLPDVESMMRSGVRVGLGNDGFSNAMWEEWKAAYLAHKLWNRDPRKMGGGLVAQMAVINNSDLVHQVFKGLRTGVIEVGAAADLILVNYHPYTPMTGGNLPWHILFGFNESMITSTLCAGRILMQDRQLVLVDEEKISAEALAKAPEIWRRYLEIVNSNGSSHD
jgi:putative selenium metabolism protein SsnA